MNGMRQLWSKERVRKHQSVSELLPAYAEGTLPGAQRAVVDAHLRTCDQCEDTLRQFRQLDLVLNDLGTAPSVPFPRFWSKLQERLPGRAEKRRPFFRPWRLATGFAVAVLASLVGVTALASDATMPDSPLYHVKRLRQTVQLAVATPHQRPRLQLALSKQRVQEAVVMVQRQRPELAVASLKDAHALIVDAAPQLESAPATQADTAELAGTIADLKTALVDAREAAEAQTASDSTDAAAVDGAISEDLNAVSQVETDVNTAGSEVIESPSPEASPSAAASREASASPEASPEPTPDASTGPQPTDTTSPEPALTP